MYYSPGFAGNASRRYAAVHAGSRVESATPHGLVKILFEELLLAMDAAALAMDKGDRLKANDKYIRTLSIIHALDASLDMDHGGEIAVGLAQIYRECRRLMISAHQTGNAADVRKAHAIISEIADAWNRIG
ncbi:flagellar export chaperone FliS [Sphingobium sp. DEHP117]|uniref:flagellar export chaperone FliS n=1 Tax=Sphingobium sp. DEHP117 TaxID=2993436 RepID=UPI0027D659B2|nr:flagellar export chaperone FliS [Sphingobium sp. DEHP117]MDQ4419592.1 flagellar export chaperone FliS [Sphingobium sp. DEHP117]